jgi:regulator of sigma E protease
LDKQEFADRDEPMKSEAATGETAPVPAEGPPEPPGSVLARYALLAGLVALGGYLLFVRWELDPGAVALLAVGLGLVIFIHELGHFLVAKWCDVHVETFSIGFGPALPGCSWRKGETLYKIAWFPLGGYVKMVGEGDTEEDDQDPRSFKNKTVGQRMAIISAGVIMNVILAAVCFVVAYMHGIERLPGVIGTVQSGSPAFEGGVHSGSQIVRIGSVERPFFDDLRYEVVLSAENEKLPFEVARPGEEVRRLQIVPDRDTSDKRNTRPMIGVGHPLSLILIRNLDRRPAPVLISSAAAKATPPFAFEDEIVATTDPDDPKSITELPLDPRDPEKVRRDYFVFRQRLQRLAGQEITIRVRRKDENQGERFVDIKVPPAYHYDLGIVLAMGKVVSVRPPAPQPNQTDADPHPIQKNDRIVAVEVENPDGTPIRWVVSRGKQGPRKEHERELDPLRLPFELKQWAERSPQQDKKVKITVERYDPKTRREDAKANVEVTWDDRFRFDHVIVDPAAPMPIPELGIAYQVLTSVKSVRPGSPAATAGIKPGDIIKSFRSYRYDPQAKDTRVAGKWESLEAEQGAYLYSLLDDDSLDFKQFDLRVERDGKLLKEEFSVTAEPDKDWFAIDRGLILAPDRRIEVADNFWHAIQLGVRDTVRFVVGIYIQLHRIATHRVSWRNITGPVGIAEKAYQVAEYNFFEYLRFLGLISINLAVINFLPIPVLDGGHMVFLIYEKLRGKPASEQVRVAATFVGLVLIVALMIFVVVWDVIRLM